MQPIAVLYATREGHTRRIAEHIAATLRARGLPAEIHDLRDVGNGADRIAINGFSGAVLAASVHFGKHEPEMVEFVKAHRAELDAMPSAFLSVNLAEAGVERPDAAAREHAQFVADVDNVIAYFFKQTGWHPQRVKAVAGALLYTRYNLLLRFVMKQIARVSGGDTDTSRDYVYTDWSGLDKFVEQFASEIPVAAAGRQSIFPSNVPTIALLADAPHHGLVTARFGPSDILKLKCSPSFFKSAVFICQPMASWSRWDS